MKTFITILCILCFVVFILPLLTTIYNNYQWKSTIYQYWDLSDRASTIDKKLENLYKFKAMLVDYGINKGQARYVFKTEATDLANNMVILDTLIERLENTASLEKNSLEYQQALKQITTDEYQGFNTCEFAHGWRRKSVLRWWFSPFIRCQDGSYSGEDSGY